MCSPKVRAWERVQKSWTLGSVKPGWTATELELLKRNLKIVQCWWTLNVDTCKPDAIIMQTICKIYVWASQLSQMPDVALGDPKFS